MKIDKLTTNFQNAISEANTLALANENQYIEPAHLLLAMINDNSTISGIFKKLNIDELKLKNDLNIIISKLPKIIGNNVEVNISMNLMNLLNSTEKESIKNKDTFISTELFLLAAVDDKGEVGKILRKYNLSKEILNKVIIEIRGSDPVQDKNSEENREALKKYTIDLTSMAMEGKLDPVIGRDDEIRRTIQVLQRRTKNNPILIGEPGVGKTAIVEGLAQRIVNNEVPEGLKNKNLLILDLASILAGAKFRGDFEERLKSVLKELSKNSGNYIIFIDEIHTLVGAGKADGAIDAGNMLKPSLARGELHCIGATTLDEYKKYIEKDPALERRFQKVLVNEPSVEDTVAILRGLQEKYEIHHGVEITDPAIVAAAELSNRYITDRFLPDKAIDLIDEAASKIKIEIDSKPEVMDKLERKLIQLKIEREAVKKEKDDLSKSRLIDINNDILKLENEFADFNEIWKSEKAFVQSNQSIRDETDKIRNEIEGYKRIGDWQKASKLQYEVLPGLEMKLKQTEGNAKRVFKLLRTEVGVEEIADVVAKATGIPTNKLLKGEKEKLIRIEEILHENIVGQNEAIDAVSNAIRRSRAGLSDPNKPYGSFLFLGPTGVGKTELCKSLAKFLFDSKDSLIRIDMSEYMEKHSVSRLIGSPPGYVGYDEGGYLTEAVKRKPYSLILFDEIEKSHPDIFNILLQILDDGRLTDGQGRVIDFKNTVIVMTSNIGSSQIQHMNKSTYDEIKTMIMEEVKENFKPEFINRIDDIVVFHALKASQMKDIAKIQLKPLIERVSSLGLKLDISNSVVDFLAEKGFDSLYGARPLKRLITQNLENVLAKEILLGKYITGDTIMVDYHNGSLVEFKKK